MAIPEKMMLRANALLKERGQEALKMARQEFSQQKIAFAPLGEALNYFLGEVWFDYLHPGLMSLACEAVGGNPKETVAVGAAFVLLAGGADVHDDIIDQSAAKGTRLTVLGKFGRDIAVLAGDALLFIGLSMMHDAVRELEAGKRVAILECVNQAFFNISSAEAKEASLRGNKDLTWTEYFEVIKMKDAVARATCEIGAILGAGSSEQIKILSDFGETLGILSCVRDDIIDVFETAELRNRAKNECLPLPILLAFQNAEEKKKIISLLDEPATDENTEEILDIALDSQQTRKFMAEMHAIMEQKIVHLSGLQKSTRELELILRAFLEDI